MPTLVDESKVKIKRTSKYDDEIFKSVNMWVDGKAVKMSGNPFSILARFRSLVKEGQIDKDFKVKIRDGAAYVVVE